jgi:NAD-dependent DNA ligase
MIIKELFDFLTDHNLTDTEAIEFIEDILECKTEKEEFIKVCIENEICPLCKDSIVNLEQNTYYTCTNKNCKWEE